MMRLIPATLFSATEETIQYVALLFNCEYRPVPMSLHW